MNRGSFLRKVRWSLRRLAVMSLAEILYRLDRAAALIEIDAAGAIMTQGKHLNPHFPSDPDIQCDGRLILL